jgi:hypothetical protein
MVKLHLPGLSAARNNTITNKGTVRIYARSLRLTNSPLAEESVHPSVIAVERAALCQIFLETKYHKTFQQPSERDLRRQTLESLVCRGKELTPEQKVKFDEILKSVESEWSRLSRVRPSIDAFRIERKLGSGGFGLVNMVTEKQTGNIYAMKVRSYYIELTSLFLRIRPYGPDMKAAFCAKEISSKKHLSLAQVGFVSYIMHFKILRLCSDILSTWLTVDILFSSTWKAAISWCYYCRKRH